MAYVGQGIKGGTFSVLDTSGNTYNGSNTTFNLGTQVGSPAQLLVSHDGVIQKPVTDYTIATGGTQITFTTAPASGASIFITEISGAVGAPMNRDINGDELILDADADTSITADTDDQIDVRIGGSDRFKLDNSGHLSLLTDSGAIKFGADSDVTLTHVADTGLTFKTAATASDSYPTLNIHTGSTDIDDNDYIGRIDFRAPDEGTGTDAITAAAAIYARAEADFSSSVNKTKLVFQTGSSGAASDKLTITNNGSISLTPEADATWVWNENAADADFRIETSGNSYTHMVFVESSAGEFNINDSAGEGTITFNQAAEDGNIVSFKSSDVAHGVTTRAETDSYMTIQKSNGPDGGAQVYHFREVAENAMYYHAVGVGSLGTGKGTGDSGLISLRAHLKGSGTDTDGSVTGNGNMMTIHSHNTTKFIFDSDGDFHADSSSTTFDTYDDAQLARAFDLSHGRGVINSKFDKFIAYNHEKLAELELVGREKDGKPNHMVNVCGMQRLHNGAIWQQYEKHNQLLEAVYDLAKEAVGEEKANAILDKHEVKRLQ